MMSEVVEEVLPGQPFAILSGPNFAHEVAKGMPSATTLAAHSPALGKRLVSAIGLPTFRPYYTNDVMGAQMGGAIKNVLAIACGVVGGARLGENARAALITRGMAEILRLGEKLGARAETLMGLSGFGDLVLTCSSKASRNYSLGFALGEGIALKDILESRNSVTEGVHTAAALCDLAKKHKIEMPICQSVNKILNQGASVEDVVKELLARPFRDEKLAGFLEPFGEKGEKLAKIISTALESLADLVEDTSVDAAELSIDINFSRIEESFNGGRHGGSAVFSGFALEISVSTKTIDYDPGRATVINMEGSKVEFSSTQMIEGHKRGVFRKEARGLQDFPGYDPKLAEQTEKIIEFLKETRKYIEAFSKEENRDFRHQLKHALKDFSRYDVRS